MRQRRTTKSFLLPRARCNFTRNCIQEALDNYAKWKIPVPLEHLFNKSLEMMQGCEPSRFIHTDLK